MNATLINITNSTAELLGEALTTSLNNTFITIIEPFTYLFFGLALLVVGQYVRNWAISIASGIWFLILATTATFGLMPLSFSSILFFILLGLVITLHSVGQFYDQNEPKTVRLNDD
jgi:hypothetical protein